MDFSEKHQGLLNALKGLIMVIVIVAVLGALGIFKTASMKVEIEEEQFTVYYEDEAVIQFSKEDIRSAEIVTSFTRGEALEVISEDRYIVGTWENEEWGMYTLCMKKALETYLVVTTDEDVFVFNYENAASTESMCNALLAW